jgi:hypothetical protein
MEKSAVFKKKDDRSPLKAKPLRVAGQSLDEAIQKVREDDVTDGAAFVAMGIMMAMFEWSRWFLNAPPQPLLISALGLCLGGYGVWRVARARHVLHQLRQGRDGERAVAEILERFREVGFRVFHDITAEGFNVDHVLVGAQGIYVIETKTITKPANKEPNIRYDGESVTLAGIVPDRDPIKQASANARWVRELVKESTGRDYPVRPVVLYPGWFVEHGANRNRNVWVLNPKVLAAFVEQEPVVLSPEDVKLASYHLSRHVRTTADT